MDTRQLLRLGAGLVVAGVVMTLWCLLSGQRSLAPSWDAVKTVASVVSSVWLWASWPRLRFEDGLEVSPWAPRT